MNSVVALTTEFTRFVLPRPCNEGKLVEDRNDRQVVMLMSRYLTESERF